MFRIFGISYTCVKYEKCHCMHICFANDIWMWLCLIKLKMRGREKTGQTIILNMFWISKVQGTETTGRVLDCFRISPSRNEQFMGGLLSLWIYNR